MHRRTFFLTALAAACAAPALAAQQPAAGIPAATGQLIMGIADGWSSTRAKLYLFQRQSPRGPWQAALKTPFPVLMGRSGLAWGHGTLPVPHGQKGVPSKREKDWRAPAGAFSLGMLFGYDAAGPQGAAWPFYQVTARDCWIDDPQHPAYNRHIVVDPAAPPPWYAKQRMRLGDSAYRWMLEIKHNANPPVPGHGSAIFFHTRRGPDKPSAGCTTMAVGDLVAMLRWLQPRAQPMYVLLPRAEYLARLNTWGLPAIP